MKAMRMLLLLIGLSVLLIGCEDAPSSNAPRVKEPEIDIIDRSAQQYSGKVLGIWKDVGGSENDDQANDGLPELLASIKERARLIDGVQVVRIANGNRSIWAEKVEKFIWGPPPVFREFDEERVMENAPIDVKMFAERKAEYIKEAHDRYTQERKRITDEYQAQVEKNITLLKDYLLKQPHEVAPCTRFTSVAERILRDNLAYNLVITDGWADCPDEQSNNIQPVNIQGPFVVLQLTRKVDSQADEEEFSQREAFLHALFPTAQILPAYLSKEAVENLFKSPIIATPVKEHRNGS